MKIALAENKILSIGEKVIELPSYNMPAMPFVFLKADTGITKDINNKVSSWENIGTHGGNFIQSILNRQPTFIENQINGHPVIRFNSSMLTIDTNILKSIPFTVYVVFKMTSAITVGFVLAWNASTSNSFALRWWMNQMRFSNPSELLIPELLPTPYLLYSGRMNNLSSEVRRNNLVTATGGTGTGQMNDLILGSWRGATPYYFFGDIAELLIFDNVLTPTENEGISGYLKDKYNL